jgi:hypothetical protein
MIVIVRMMMVVQDMSDNNDDDFTSVRHCFGNGVERLVLLFS